MRIDASRALGGYAAAATLACLWLALGGAATNDARFRVLDVERINVREPDGTLRLTIANSKRQPGLFVGGRELPHPNRTGAGMIFFNDEGVENGGLMFDGGGPQQRAHGGGSLTFDRYRQDQVVQLFSDEDGPARQSGVRVFDRPDGAMDLTHASSIVAMPDGAARTAAITSANLGGQQRGFFGRSDDGSARLDLRDAAGKVRLSLRVASDGAAAVEFRDAAGHVTRTMTPD